MIQIKFVDFWPSFDVTDNYFLSKLKKVCEVKISENPEIIFFSIFGKKHRKYKCRKLLFTGERGPLPFRSCDFSLSFDRDTHDDRNLRWPLYQLYGNLEELTQPKDIDSIMAEKSQFCNFIYGNKNAKERLYFFERLSRYKKIDSGGSLLNNIGRTVNDKLSFIRNYKFTIAFENRSYPGYITEKIFHPYKTSAQYAYLLGFSLC